MWEPKTLVVAPLVRDRASDVGQVDGLAAVEAAFAAGEGKERVDQRLLFGSESSSSWPADLHTSEVDGSPRRPAPLHVLG